MKKLSLLFLLAAGLAFADTPPPGAVKIKNSSGAIIDPATETTLAILNGKVPASPAEDHITAASPNSCRLSDGSAFYKGTTPSDTQPVSIASSVAVTGTFFQATQPVSGPLTDAQLRATAVPVSGTFFQATQPVSIAAPVPVTGTFFQATQPVSGSVSVSGSVAVTGPLTDTQLRASAVPVSISGSVPVTGGLTDTQLRASAVPVTDSTVNSTLGSPFQAGGSIGNSSFGISGLLPAYSATPTFNVGTTGGLALDSSVSSLSAKFGSLGQKAMTGSAPVVLASDQSAIPVTGTFFQATQPVSGSLGRSWTLGFAGDKVDASGSSVSVSNSFALDATLSSLSAKFNSLGQKTMANSAPVVLSSDQSAIPVTGTFFQATQPVSGTFFQATQPVSAASLPLPSGAATSAKQPALGTAGTASADVITVQGIAGMTAVKVDGSAVTQPVSIASSVQTKAPLNTTGSGSAAAATVSTVSTLTAPANAVGFILMNLDVSTTNMRWAVGRTASTTLGQQLQPGRDTGFVPVGANISIIAESGTVTYDVQWVSQ